MKTALKQFNPSTSLIDLTGPFVGLLKNTQELLNLKEQVEIVNDQFLLRKERSLYFIDSPHFTLPKELKETLNFLKQSSSLVKTKSPIF